MSDARGGRVRILHVDDERDLAEMTARYLERRDDRIRVQTTTRVEAALDRLAEGGFDCVVSDYDMDDGTGLDLLRAVRERHGDLPFVLFTGKGSEEIASEAISAGVDDYLQKETGADQYAVLANRVTNLVEGHRATVVAAESEQRYHSLLDTAPTPIALFDEDAELIYVNDAGVEMLAYEDAEAMRGEPMPSFVHPDDRDLALDRFESISNGCEAASTVELRLLTADGEVKHAKVATTPGTYDGEFVAQTALRDVTPRRRTQRALESERELVDQALDTLDDVFYVLDSDGSFDRWNDRLNEVTGLSDEELAGTDPLAFFPEGEDERVAAAIARVMEEGQATVEATADLPGGETRFEFRGRRLTGADGDVVGVCGIGRDVSERRQREEALRELNDFATEISTYDGREAVCERTVAAAENVLEYDLCVVNLEEDGTLPIAAISSEMPPDGAIERSVDDGLVGLTYREGESFLVEDLSEHPEADPRGPYRSAISVPVGDHGVFQTVDGELGAFDETDLELVELLVAHCASALDRIEHEAVLAERTETLERQNERLEEFAGIVSHDLRNPLNVVQTSVDLVRETGEDAHLDDVEDAVGTMNALVDDLLTLARQGEVVDERETVDVGVMAERCWDDLAVSGASLRVEDPPAVAADPDRLRQAVENLLGNAVEHGGSEVTVGTVDGDRGFYVADDGPGIPEGDREQVFDAGFTTSDDGTGFGLRIVGAVAEGHGWSVSVTESAAGGARFEVHTEG